MISKKILILGEIGVGKTSLVRRFVLDELPSDYQATMGVDIYRYQVDGLGETRSKSLDLVIWDSDGSFGTSIFSHPYAKGTSGALIVGDLTRPTTLDLMVKLAEGFDDAMPGREFTFVFNKTDLMDEGEDVVLPQPLKVARQHKVWTSAVTAENVTSAFVETADAIIRREI
ncbi:MAG: Rab family GTPase [Hyphomicrobiaceae bacterium]